MNLFDQAARYGVKLDPPSFLPWLVSGLDPDLAFATPDHAVSSQPGRVATTFPLGGKLHAGLKQLTGAMGVQLFDLGEPGQGIVHVMGPEMGIVLPGLTVICGDSHTCTNGGLGAMAFGVGSSESTHALATQTLRRRSVLNQRILISTRETKGAAGIPSQVIGWSGRHPRGRNETRGIPLGRRFGVPFARALFADRR